MSEIEGIPVGDLKGAQSWETARRPTGQEVFDALSTAEQDELIGKPAADKIRAGEATLADFIDRSGGFITQKPVQDV